MNLSLSLLLLLGGTALQERVPVLPRESLTRSGPQLFVIHDIDDLVRPPTGAGGELDAELRKQQQVLAAQHLITTVRAFIVPPFEADLDELTAPSPDTLVALCTRAQQDWIREFLDLQRRSQGRLIDVQTAIVMGPRGAFGKLLGTERSATTLEDPSVLAGLMQHFKQESEFELVSAPRLMVRDRQRAQLSVLTEVAYVKEYRLRLIHPGDVELADPVVETVREGVEIEVIGTPLEDDLYALGVELDLTKLERPIATRKVRLRAGKDGEFEVGMPEVNTVAVESQLLLVDGATAVLLVASPTEERDLAVFITFRIIYTSARMRQAPPPGTAPGEERAR